MIGCGFPVSSLARIRKTDNAKWWQGCRVTHCCGNVEMLQSFGKQFSNPYKIKPTFSLWLLLPRFFTPQEMKTYLFKGGKNNHAQRISTVALFITAPNWKPPNSHPQKDELILVCWCHKILPSKKKRVNYRQHGCTSETLYWSKKPEFFFESVHVKLRTGKHNLWLTVSGRQSQVTGRVNDGA